MGAFKSCRSRALNSPPPDQRSASPSLKSMFGGGHFGCKCQLLEPHFAIFSLHSTAMKLKNAFVRTQNLTFSLQKRHLQTCSKLHRNNEKRGGNASPRTNALPVPYPKGRENLLQRSINDGPVYTAGKYFGLLPSPFPLKFRNASLHSAASLKSGPVPPGRVKFRQGLNLLPTSIGKSWSIATVPLSSRTWRMQ